MVTTNLLKDFLFNLPRPTNWREGQFVYNMMYRLYPKVVNQVNFDCFYNNKNIDKFLEECTYIINNNNEIY